MLTSTDIHYLVGLLTKVTVPDDVDIELGERVYDIAAQKNRDVDITVKHRNKDGTITAFLGLEVKDTSRPLTLEHIEQLCRKFQDMPEITHKAIVSASGYTKSAIRKATHYNLELFHLVPWNDPAIGFKQAIIPRDKELTSEILYNWKYPPAVAMEVPVEYHPLLKEIDLNQLEVYLENSSPIPGCPNGQKLALLIANHAAKESAKAITGKLQSEQEDQLAKWIVEPTEKTYVKYNSILIPIIQFRVLGMITYSTVKRETIYKILIKHGEAIPYVGCAITEMSNGNLVGVTVNNENKEMSVINISLMERQRSKITKQRL